MLSTFFTAVPILLGVVLMLAAGWEFMTWKQRFTGWRGGVATSQGARKIKGDVGPRLAYEYIVDGVNHEGVSSYMRDSLPEKGRKISIYYDPANPSASDWYDAGMHNFFMFGVALLGAFLIWLAVF